MNVIVTICSCYCVLSTVLYIVWVKTDSAQILTSGSYCLLEVLEKYRFKPLVMVTVST